MKFNIKNHFSTLVVIALVATAGFNGYLIGQNHPKTIIIKGVDNLENDTIKNVDFNTFWQTWEIINKDYLRSDKIDNQKLVHGSAVGLVGSLDDPYSVFFPPDDSKKFADDIKGKFGGIGAEIGYEGDFVVVIAPLKESPAEKAGLKPGDKILSIDGEALGNEDISDIVKKIRGPEGSKVVLTLLSVKDKKPRDVSIERGIIKIPTVEWEMREKNIGYIQLFNFNEDSPQLFADGLNELLERGAEGFVIDLRNNPGGFLDAAVKIAGIFVEPGNSIVREEFRSHEGNDFKASGSAILKDFPLVVLVNRGSASASEILAGALRDHGKATLVGEKTFGKGTVQELKDLPDGSSIKLTVAHWVLPKGDTIDGEGIKPEIEIEQPEPSPEDEKNGDQKERVDAQLNKAIETLMKKMDFQKRNQ